MTSEEEYRRRGSYTHGVGRRSRFSGDVTAQYNLILGKHFIMANAAASMSENTSREISYSAEGFPSDRLNDMAFALQYALNGKPAGSENTVRDVGFTGLVSYLFDERYMADLTLRMGASSVYSPKTRWTHFWSAGAGWNMHKEAWMENADWVKRLKLRTSIGTTGNQNTTSAQTTTTYNYYSDTYYRGFRPGQSAGGYSAGAHILRLANESLLWQEELAFNAGLDATLGRFTMVFDYYISTTNNMVSDISLPPSTGYFTVIENVGKVRNEGWEFRLVYNIINRPRLFMNLTGAVASNKNTLLELSDAMRYFNSYMDDKVADRIDGGRWQPVPRYVEGGSVNSIWAVPSLGINPENGREIYVRPDGSTSYTWSPLYQQIVGDARERYRGNFGLNGEWRNFGWTVMCRFSLGADHYNSTLVQKVENADLRWNVDRRVFLGRWSEDNREAPFKRLAPYNDAQGNYVTNPRTQPTSRFVQRRNELDIAAVSLYYDFRDVEAVRRLGFNRLRLGFNMNEIHKFSSIKVERGTTYPFARTMQFSLSAEF
jgi:hypothetical protein